nr:hypothetical protein [Tanacetum cinerariifolium]
MAKPLSPDRVFDFPKDDLKPHPVYDFFAPAPLPGYAAMVDEQMVVPAIEKVAEPVAEAGMMTSRMMIKGFDEEEAWEVNEEWLMAPITPPSVPVRQPPSVYEVGGPSTIVAEGPSFPHLAPRLSIPPFVIEDLSTRLGNLEYEHGQRFMLQTDGSRLKLKLSKVSRLWPRERRRKGGLCQLGIEGKRTWGGREKGFGTVPVRWGCTGMAGEEVVLLAGKTV